MARLMALIAAAVSMAACGADAVEWTNLDQAHHVAGQKATSGYLRGKVVLVDRRDYGDPANAAAIGRLKAIWASYRSKPFILLGSHCGPTDAKAAAALAARLGVQYPVYADTMPEGLEPGPGLFIVDAAGVVRNLTAAVRDRVTAAMGDVGQAIMEATVPDGPEQYAKYLDFEVTNLPGRALLRLMDFRARHPGEARRYDADWKRLSSSDEVKRLAKLVELARQVKDRDKSSANSQRLSSDVLEKAFDKYAPLARSEDPAVAQEAKNALADIRRVSMELSPGGMTAAEARKGKTGGKNEKSHSCAGTCGLRCAGGGGRQVERP